MVTPVLLQQGPETFRVLFGDGHVVIATLTHATRRGLGLPGVPPLQVASEIVAFLLERNAFPRDDGAVVSLGASAGRFPEFVEELRARLG